MIYRSRGQNGERCSLTAIRGGVGVVGAGGSVEKA